MLQSERLILRQLTDSDGQSVFDLRSDHRVNHYLNRQTPANLNDVAVFIDKINIGIRNKEWNYWGICLKENPQLIGTICLWNFTPDKKVAEIGYELKPEYQKRGYANEALHCIIDYSSKMLKLRKLIAFTHTRNHASRQLLVKNQFIPDNNVNNKPKNTDDLMYKRIL